VTKRIFDLFFSFFGLIILSPFFLIISSLIPIDSRGPILFKQSRVGYKGKLFNLLKFRTMVRDADNKPTRLTTKNDSRITRLGKILRKYKIDELPQLLNVLKGDMSIVGPRPELPEYVELFRDDYDEILKVKPGITDAASIKFRNESELLDDSENTEKTYVNQILPQKIELYQEYVKNRTLFSDLRLICLTIFHLTKK
jgi:lipopolysaccharide/colanic/teichoic acid biosynthesis glycosyltransferase